MASRLHQGVDGGLGRRRDGDRCGAALILERSGARDSGAKSSGTIRPYHQSVIIWNDISWAIFVDRIAVDSWIVGVIHIYIYIWYIVGINCIYSLIRRSCLCLILCWKMLAVVFTSCKKSSRKSSSFLLKRNGVSELNEQGLYIAIEAKSSRISFSLGPKCPSPSAVLPYPMLPCLLGGSLPSQIFLQALDWGQLKALPKCCGMLWHLFKIL